MRISDWSSDVCSSDLLDGKFESEFLEEINFALVPESLNIAARIFTDLGIQPIGHFWRKNRIKESAVGGMKRRVRFKWEDPPACLRQLGKRRCVPVGEVLVIHVDRAHVVMPPDYLPAFLASPEFGPVKKHRRSEGHTYELQHLMRTHY